MSITYYNCLPVPEEIELLIMGMKRGMEIYDIQVINKKKLSVHINNFNNIVYEGEGFYYKDIIDPDNAMGEEYYRWWIRYLKDKELYRAWLFECCWELESGDEDEYESWYYNYG